MNDNFTNNDNLNRCSKKTDINDKPPFYEELLRHYKWGKMPDDKQNCIKETINQLLKDGEGAEDPVLLLGHVQGGKTDTYLHAIGLAIDNGIDIAIILVNDNNNLMDQTFWRTFYLYEPINDPLRVETRKITKIKEGQHIKSFNDCKGIIVCKKNKHNLQWLINDILTPGSPLLNKRVMIIDDEADIASRNFIEKYQSYSSELRRYFNVIKSGRKALCDELYHRTLNCECMMARMPDHGILVQRWLDHLGKELNDSEFGDKTSDREWHAFRSLFSSSEFRKALDLAKIAMQIDILRYCLDYCRYLQVTATPFSLLLQPYGKLNLNGRQVQAFRPRYTSIAPSYKGYVGQKEFFKEAKDEESMYSHLFHPVETEHMKAWYQGYCIRSASDVESEKASELVYAIFQYVMATAVRTLQSESEGKVAKTTAAIHVSTKNERQDSMKQNVDFILEELHSFLSKGMDSNPYFKNILAHLYKDLYESNTKGRSSGYFRQGLPTLEMTLRKMKILLDNNEISNNLVNHKNKESFSNGTFNLEKTGNIFIGGILLDRGITIPNLIMFFYGRDSQGQDTTMQHIRLFGNRKLTDMAVTRWYATEENHSRIERMFEIDEDIRKQIILAHGNTGLGIPFVGFDKDFKPCAPNKVAASDIQKVKASTRYLPHGMWTLPNEEARPIVNKIESTIITSEYYAYRDQDGFFECPVQWLEKIIKKVYKLFVFDKEYQNVHLKRDLDVIMCLLSHCAMQSGERVILRLTEERSVNRVKADGSFERSPDSSEDREKAKSKAIHKPVLTLIKEKGNWNNGKGWNNAPFFWPMLYTPSNLSPSLFTVGVK